MTPSSIIDSFDDPSTICSIFTDPVITGLIVAVWSLFTFAPFDLAFRIIRIFGFVMPVFSSLVTALEVAMGRDGAKAAGFSPLPSLLLGIGIGCAKPLILTVYGLIMDQDVRKLGPIMFDVIVAAIVYLTLQDFSVAIDSARVLTFVVLAGLEVVRYFVRDQYYLGAWKRIERVVALVVPYYGKTWVARGELADHATVKWTNNTRRWLRQKITGASVVKAASLVLLIITATMICFPQFRQRLLRTRAR
jgi:hypothetical protein